MIALGYAAGALVGRRLLRWRERRLVDSIRAAERVAREQRESRNAVGVGGLATLGCTLGHFYPPLLPLNLVLVGYGMEPAVRRAEVALRERREVQADGYASLVTLVCLLGEQYFAAALNLTLYHMGSALLTQGRERLAEQAMPQLLRNAPEVWTLGEGGEMATPLTEVTQGAPLVLRAGELLWVEAEVVAGEGVFAPPEEGASQQAYPAAPGMRLVVGTLLLRGRLVLRASQSGVARLDRMLEGLLQQTAERPSLLEQRLAQLTRASYLPVLGLSVVGLPLAGLVPVTALLFNAPQNTLGALMSRQRMEILQRAAEHGLWIRDARLLEGVERLDCLLIDPRGTLTASRPTLEGVECYAHFDRDQILQMALDAPEPLPLPEAETLREALAGWGEGLDGVRAHLGDRAYLQRHGIRPPPEGPRTPTPRPGERRLFVVLEAEVVGAVRLHYPLREQALALLEQLRERGVRRLELVTAEGREGWAELLLTLPLSGLHAELGPVQRAELVERLKGEGYRVGYLGNHFADLPAMRQADLSICLDEADEALRHSADLVVEASGLAHLPQLRDAALALQLRQTVIPGFWFSYVLFNSVGVVLLHFTPAFSALLLAATFGSAYRLIQLPSRAAVEEEHAEGGVVLDQGHTFTLT